jgi:vancomycin resistance protein YoaR
MQQNRHKAHRRPPRERLRARLHFATLPGRRSSRSGRRRRASRPRNALLVRRVVILAVLACVTGVVVGLAFAGSPERLAEGVRIAGVDVGGLTPRKARALLERRASALENTPVEFHAAGHTWRLSAEQLGVRADWAAAVDAVRHQGDGFGPVRGFRRLDLRFFGADVAPRTQVEAAALQYVLDQIAARVDTAHTESRIVLHGLDPVIVPGRKGQALDRRQAATTIVGALAGLTREPVELPVRTVSPSVSAGDLNVAQAQVRTALSAPVRLILGKTRWRLTPRKIATLLELPADGRTKLQIGGPGANRWFGALARSVDRAPVDADFAITKSGIRVIPDRDGYALDVPESAQKVLRAALVSDPALRRIELVAQTTHAERTRAEAEAMHISGLVAAYTTYYGGDPNRVHNVQLVAHLVDRHVIAPGATFSFNETTGARTADKGFREAPVIINGELKTGLGGGVCQVSTTVFNAAYEAGLPITERTNHALYISHYPQGRDATVNYPDIDLKFVNDTGHWLLLRTWVGSSSLTVALYGTAVHRRVVTDTAPLVTHGTIPEKAEYDASRLAGERVVEDVGEPARTTSVRRRVYTADGKLLLDATFYSSYRAEPTVVRVGTHPRPKPEPTPTTTTTTTTIRTTTTTTTPTKPKPKPPATTTTTATTTPTQP